MATIDNIQGGLFQDAGGNALNGGSITFQLSAPAQTINDGQAVQNVPITFTLNSSGSVPNGSALYGNDQLTPLGTVYVVRIYNASGALVRGPENWVVSGTSPIDIGGIAASTPTISYPALVPGEVAKVALSAQTAAIGSTPLYTVVNGPRIRVSFEAKVTTAATSSTLGPFTLFYTALDGTSVTLPVPWYDLALGHVNGGMSALTTNSLTTGMIGIPALLNCTVGTAISYSFGYGSTPAAGMGYELVITAEQM